VTLEEKGNLMLPGWGGTGALPFLPRVHTVGENISSILESIKMVYHFWISITYFKQYLCLKWAVVAGCERGNLHYLAVVITLLGQERRSVCSECWTCSCPDIPDTLQAGGQHAGLYHCIHYHTLNVPVISTYYFWQADDSQQIMRTKNNPTMHDCTL